MHLELTSSVEFKLYCRHDLPLILYRFLFVFVVLFLTPHSCNVVLGINTLRIVVLCMLSIRTISHSQLGKLTMNETEKTVLSDSDYNSKGMMCTFKEI